MAVDRDVLKYLLPNPVVIGQYPKPATHFDKVEGNDRAWIANVQDSTHQGGRIGIAPSKVSACLKRRCETAEIPPINEDELLECATVRLMNSVRSLYDGMSNPFYQERFVRWGLDPTNPPSSIAALDVIGIAMAARGFVSDATWDATPPRISKRTDETGIMHKLIAIQETIAQRNAEEVRTTLRAILHNDGDLQLFTAAQSWVEQALQVQKLLSGV